MSGAWAKLVAEEQPNVAPAVLSVNQDIHLAPVAENRDDYWSLAVDLDDHQDFADLESRLVPAADLENHWGLAGLDSCPAQAAAPSNRDTLRVPVAMDIRQAQVVDIQDNHRVLGN